MSASEVEQVAAVPLRLLTEARLALDAATTIGKRSCRDGDHLHYANHDRLIAELWEYEPELVRRLVGPQAAAVVSDRADRDQRLRAAVKALTYMSDDGTEYEHNEGCQGEAECPACWAADLRALLDSEPTGSAT